jgi:hypothetical protein
MELGVGLGDFACILLYFHFVTCIMFWGCVRL